MKFGVIDEDSAAEAVRMYLDGASVVCVSREYHRTYGEMRKILTARLSEMGLRLRGIGEQRLAEERLKDRITHPVEGEEDEDISLDPKVAEAAREVQKNWTKEEEQTRRVVQQQNHAATIPIIKSLVVFNRKRGVLE